MSVVIASHICCSVYYKDIFLENFQLHTELHTLSSTSNIQKYFAPLQERKLLFIMAVNALLKSGIKALHLNFIRAVFCLAIVWEYLE